MTPTRSARELFEHFVHAASAAAPRQSPRTDESKALVRRYFEMWNLGDGRLADGILAPTYLDHAHPEVLGPAAFRSLVPRYHAAHPDAHMAIVFAAADEDFVAVRNTITRRELGRTVASEGIALFRVEGGKLAEQWSWYPQTEPEDEAIAPSPPSIDAWLSHRA